MNVLFSVLIQDVVLVDDNDVDFSVGGFQLDVVVNIIGDVVSWIFYFEFYCVVDFMGCGAEVEVVLGVVMNVGGVEFVQCIMILVIKVLDFF